MNAKKFHNYPLPVENIPTFRRYTEPVQAINIPEVSHRRKLTDVAFLVVFGIFFIALFGFMGYTLYYSDIDRFVHGYDRCGNICGKKNDPVDGVDCSGEDMTDKPYIVYTELTQYDSFENSYTVLIGSCVPECLSSFFMNRCTEESEFFPRLVDAFQTDYGRFIALCFVGLVVSIIMVVLLRYFVKIFVWIMVVVFLLLLVGLTAFFWYFVTVIGTAGLVMAIILTIVTLIMLLIMYFARSRVNLTAGFIKQAAKAIFFMPLILFEPLLTLLSQFISLGLFICTTIYMATSGSLTRFEGYNETYYEYALNAAMIFALVLNAFVYLWMTWFILACQQMVISGAVTAYFFTKDKLALISPIYNSFYNTVRYHLGSAAFGSLLITIMTILKRMAESEARNNNNIIAVLLLICIRCLRNILKYLTSMAYIEISMHGQSLCRSGARALELILANALSAVVLNSFSSFVFFMAKCVVVGITVGIGAAIRTNDDYFWAIIIIGAVVAFFISHCFFVVFEVATDTIFLCYCEDQCVNDGEVNPFYTTLEVSECIKEAQKIQKQIDDKKRKQKKGGC